MEEGGLKVAYVNQKSDGYRDHTAMDREVLQLSGHFKPSDKQRLTTQLLYADLYYELPGALTAAQLEENPRQARPGSAAQNAFHRPTVHVWNCVPRRINSNPDFSNTNFPVYHTVKIFENPFNLDLQKRDPVQLLVAGPALPMMETGDPFR